VDHTFFIESRGVLVSFFHYDYTRIVPQHNNKVLENTPPSTMSLKLECKRGEEITIDNTSPAHPIFQSSFVENILECVEDDDECKAVSVPSPFSQEDIMDFLDLILLANAGDTRMGFGKHCDLTYRQVFERERRYYSWGKAQKNPSGPLKDFIEWADFYTKWCKLSTAVLPIAK
jgi:hypothetical protein